MSTVGVIRTALRLGACASRRLGVASPLGSPTSSGAHARLPRVVGGALFPSPRFASRASASADGADFPDASGSVRTIRVTRLSGSDVGALSDVLLSLGATACVVDDADVGTAREEEVFAGDDKVWRACNLVAYFPDDAAVAAIVSDAEQILDGKIAHRRETVPGDDWVGVVMDAFEPTKIRDGVWIVPEWRVADHTREHPDAALNIVLEPGLAFGTGEHATTRLCVGWLHDRAEWLRGKRVVDFGTGSGVLAIAALLVGAERAVGVDVEAQSVQAAARNAALNAVDDRLRLVEADGSDDAKLPAEVFADPGADLLIANILIGPVLALENLFARVVAPGGKVCLSGVLATQTPSVLERYREHFDELVVEEEDGWAVVSGVRNERDAPREDIAF